MSENSKKTGTYNGVKFELTDCWKFYVPDLDKTCDSYEQVTTAIDNAEKRLKAVKRVKLNLPVVTNKGESAVITGVHAGHGKAITKPKFSSWETRYFLPDVPWIHEAMERQRKLKAESQRIETVLEAVQFSGDSGGYIREFDGTPEGLQALYERKLAEATATSLEELLAQLPQEESEAANA